MKNSTSVSVFRLSWMAIALQVAMLSVSVARAGGPPIPFDGFTVTDGEINAACPIVGGVQAVCEVGVSDDGMLQRDVTVPSGPAAGSYLQFILTEPGVSGDASADPFSLERGTLMFTNEDFVAQDHRTDGISSQSRIIESTMIDPFTEERFINEFEYNYGWANGSTGRWVDNFQRISTVDYSGTDPVETFYTEADTVFDGEQFDTYADIMLKQGMNLNGGGSTGIQKFQFDKKAGNANLNLPCNSFPSLVDCTITLPEGTLTWNQAETITAFWIGQIISDAGTSDQEFGHTRFENQDTVSEISETSLEDAEAAGGWTDESLDEYIDGGGATPIPGNYAFDPVDPLATGMNTVSPTAVVSAPLPLQPSVPTGTASADMTVVTVPLPYDGWTVSNGVYTLDPCPVDSCGAPIVNSGGLLQRIVVIDGEEYVHTILTDKDATGDPETADFDSGSLTFKNESIVKMDEFVQGIANRLHIAERDLAYQNQNPGFGVPLSSKTPLPETAGDFVYTAEVKSGWAHGGPNDPILSANQTILVEDNNILEASSYYDRFSIKRGETNLDTEMELLAVIGTSTASNGTIPKPIMFATAVISGAFQNTSHALTDPALLPSTGGNLAWSPGDALQSTWVGGNYPTVNPGGVSIIDTVSFTNLSTGDRIESTATNADDGVDGPLYDPDPEAWVSFGTMPDYTDPFAVP